MIALFLLASVCGGEFDGVGGVFLAPLFDSATGTFAELYWDIRSDSMRLFAVYRERRSTVCRYQETLQEF